MTTNTLPLPRFFNPKNAYEWGYDPNHSTLLFESTNWRRTHKIRPGMTDQKQTLLLLIDLQRDFCFPQGTLFVGGRSGTGAMDNNVSIAQFIYQNMATISDIRVTMDTHFPFQIFSPESWITKDGSHPAPFTDILVDDIRKGTYKPNPAIAAWVCGDYGWLNEYVKFYCEKLEQAKKYNLYLWPPHCLLGSTGHSLAGVIQEARMFHAYTRSLPGMAEVKGGNYLTENYSVLKPEVMIAQDGRAIAQRNARFIEQLMKFDRVIIAGQADSHCVAWTIDDLLTEIHAVDPSLTRKVYVMTDCMSAVTVPSPAGGFYADFTDAAQRAHQRFADAGMNIVSSQTPMSEWTQF